MKTRTELGAFGKLAVGILAGGLISSCGTVDSAGTGTSDDPVSASMKTHQEFEQYWGSRRGVAPVEVAPAEQSAPVEPVVESYAVEEVTVEPVMADSNASWEPEEYQVDGPKPSKKDALTVTTWWEYQGDTGRGARDYSNLRGVGYPTGKSVWGSRRYVLSPYHGGYVNVGDAPRGALVADPNYDMGERKYFILP